ncbi:hypothetical protein [Saccharothrix longispora]|uniref:Rv1733c family protein n=1 Tax=Saccharothrix longispora TaxID=33920 RepID=UPI0028FD7380|nr:hypothetical protein [Saccharothrix longispora]MDU0292334.1 hypothetical protein [Saccharothrix longispora]
MDAGQRLMLLVRRVFPRRNPIAEPGDRVEAAVAAVVVAVALLGVPVAAAVGSEVHVARAATSAEQSRTRHPVDAVLQRAAPSSDVRTTAFSRVPARWVLPDGTTRDGEVTVARDLVAGSRVRIWLDPTGAPVAPPLTAEGAAVAAVVAAGGVWLALSGAAALTYVLVRVVHSRARRRRLEAEWAGIEPQWRRST